MLPTVQRGPGEYLIHSSIIKMWAEIKWMWKCGGTYGQKVPNSQWKIPLKEFETTRAKVLWDFWVPALGALWAVTPKLKEWLEQIRGTTVESLPRRVQSLEVCRTLKPQAFSRGPELEKQTYLQPQGVRGRLALLHHRKKILDLNSPSGQSLSLLFACSPCIWVDPLWVLQLLSQSKDLYPLVLSSTSWVERIAPDFKGHSYWVSGLDLTSETPNIKGFR